MTHKRFILHPGYVRSTYDGQEHYISAGQLARLYGVDQQECVVHSEHSKFERDPEIRVLMPLFPRQDGKYKEHLEQQKIADFQAYVRSRKLFDYHDSGASPKPREVRRMLAERLSLSISWHELHWPDFPAAYERYVKR